MRAGRVGFASADDPNSAGCVDRHRMASEALRTSTKVPGCSSCNKSLVRPAKPLQLGGSVDVVVDPGVVVDVVCDPGGDCDGKPPAPFGDGVPDAGNDPPPGRWPPSLPRAPSRPMCD